MRICGYYCSPRDNILTRHIFQVYLLLLPNIILYKCCMKGIHDILSCHLIKDLSREPNMAMFLLVTSALQTYLLN
jgi:hypothetical protein